MAKELTTEDGELDPEAAVQFLDDFADANRPEPPADEAAKATGEAKAGRQRGKNGQFLPAAKLPEGNTETTETTPPADDSDEEDPAADDQAEGDDPAAGDDPGSDDEWMTTEDAKELLASLEISEEQAREMSGLDELQRHQQLVDKRFLEEGKKPAEKPGADKEAEEAAAAEIRAKKARDAAKPGDETGFKSQLDRDDPEGFQHDLIDEIERVGSYADQRLQQMEARYETRLQEMDSRFNELTAGETRKTFDAICDSLGQEELLGSSEAPNREARDKLHDTVETLAAGLQARGKPADVTPAFVKRALKLEFADAIEKQRRASFNRTVLQQSRRKLGSGGKPAAGNGQPYKGDPAKNPELLAAYEELAQEHGN